MSSYVPQTTLVVEVIVSLVFESSASGSGLPAGSASSRSTGSAVGEAEIVSESTALLEGLREHLVLLDVLVGHGSAGEAQGLLEVARGDLGHLVVVVVHVHVGTLRRNNLL